MKSILEYFPLARQKSASEFCSPCPNCGGLDRFTLWPSEGPTGRYYCRGCNASGDGIDFLRNFMGMTYPEACASLGIAPKDKRSFQAEATASQVKAARPKEQQSIMPPEKWSEQAAVVLDECQREFLRSTEAVTAICAERFIGQNTAITCGLGWHSRDEYFTRESFGLPSLQGKTKMIVPKGLVLATKRDGKVIALTIRCPDDRPKERPRYWQVAGSGQVPFIVGQTGVPVILMESALDAVLTYQEGQGHVASIATMGSSKPLDDHTRAFIEQAPLIVACPDTDTAGDAAWDRWSQAFPKAVRILPVGAKDLTDMHALATLQHMRGEQRTAPFVGEWLRIALEIARR